ncbi:MAG: hypothetical protein V4479_09535 [Actinomycetota bacterium]
MKRFSQFALSSVVTPEQLLDRVSEVVGVAARQQLWLMFLDERDVQLPEIIPIDVPARPEERARDSFETFVSQVVEATACWSVIAVLERPGARALSADDRAWFRLIRDAVGNAGVNLRGPLLSHSTGVGLIEPEDVS